MKRVIYFLLGCICLVAAATIVTFQFFYKPASADAIQNAQSAVIAASATAEPTPTPDPAEAAPEVTPEPYVCPIDFESLQAVNPDIYAWLYIPGTDINYPLCSNPESDTYYLTHNDSRKATNEGALFSEVTYNPDPLNDWLTVIYGHRLNDGKLFGTLQQTFESRTALETNPDLIVYTPDAEYRYTLYAATRFDKIHLLWYYNEYMEQDSVYWFLHDISSTRVVNAYTNPDLTADTDGHYLVLSTCLYGNNTRRFLVVAQLSEIIR